MNTMNASKIVDLLSTRHEKDVFISELGIRDTGKVMDSWALIRHYPMSCVGYEIKVSRQDFANDEKWRGYLPFCNRFYFVCPSKLILPEELPEDTGLLWVASTGSRLYRKKLAPFRDIQISTEFWMSIMFNKMTVSYQIETLAGKSREDYWRNWLAEKKEKNVLGWNVGRRIRELVTERIDKVDVENRKLKKDIEKLEEVKRILDELGISPSSWYITKTDIKDRVAEFLSCIPRGLDDSIVNLVEQMKRVLDGIRKCKSSLDEKQSESQGLG